MKKAIAREIKKCIKSPWYLANKYLTIKDADGRILPFITHLSEKEFNEIFKKL
jgi:hypothetical protein